MFWNLFFHWIFFIGVLYIFGNIKHCLYIDTEPYEEVNITGGGVEGRQVSIIFLGLSTYHYWVFLTNGCGVLVYDGRIDCIKEFLIMND